MYTAAPGADSAPLICYGPDNKPYERWWDAPLTPTVHASMEVAPHLLTQVSEDQAGGKRSCILTAQLNALVVRGTLNPVMASTVQAELTTNETFAQLWKRHDDEGRLAWPTNPTTLAFVLNQAFGVRIGVEHLTGLRLLSRIEERLREGFVAAILGRSVVGGHTRVAFEPVEHPGRLFVHDPKYAEVTGLREYSDLPTLQTGARAMIY
jgi:hypothetical protein